MVTSTAAVVPAGARAEPSIPRTRLPLLIAALVAGVLINIDKTAAAEGDPAPETGDLEAALAT